MSNSNQNEKLSRLRHECGLEAYGFYWLVLEIIASNLDEKLSTFVQLPTKFWAKTAGISPKNLQKIVKKCEEIGLFNVTVSGQNTTIDCPNILKWKDEYTNKKHRKQESTPDEARCIQIQSTDTEIEEDIPAPQAAPKKSVKKTNPDVKIFIDWYFEEHRNIHGSAIVISGGRDGEAIKKTLGTLTLDELKSRASRFLTADDIFPENDRSICQFIRQVNRYCINKKQNEPHIPSKKEIDKLLERN